MEQLLRDAIDETEAYSDFLKENCPEEKGAIEYFSGQASVLRFVMQALGGDMSGMESLSLTSFRTYPAISKLPLQERREVLRAITERRQQKGL